MADDPAKNGGLKESDFTDPSTPEENKEESAPTEQPSDDKKSDDKKEEAPIDYKAELEKKERELEQARFLLKQKNIASKERSKEGEKSEDDEPDADPAPDVTEQLEQFKLEQLSDSIAEELSKIENPDERALTEFHFKNSVKRTGDTRAAIRADLETARFLANKPRFEKLSKELEVKEKATPSDGAGSAGNPIKGDQIKDAPLSDADLELLKRFGIDPKTVTNN